MSQLTRTPQSKSNRPRVQFSMNRKLFTTYQQLQALAEEHRIQGVPKNDKNEPFPRPLFVIQLFSQNITFSKPSVVNQD